MTVQYSQSNLIIPQLDNDPAILKVIHDGEKLECETYRKELLELLKIQPSKTSHSNEIFSETMKNSSNQESIQSTPASQTDFDHHSNQVWNKRYSTMTPNSYYSRQRNSRVLNSSGESLNNRSFNSSPKSGNQSFMKSTRSESNLFLSPVSMNKTSPTQSNGNPTTKNISWTPSGVLVTDYRQSMTMKRIVNPQWNIIPFM